MSAGWTWGVYPASLPQRQDGPLTGRSRSRSDCFFQQSYSPDGDESAARAFLFTAGYVARTVAETDLVAGVGTGLFRP